MPQAPAGICTWGFRAFCQRNPTLEMGKLNLGDVSRLQGGYPLVALVTVCPQIRKLSC